MSATMIMHVRTSVPLLVLVASKVAHNKAVSWADITKSELPLRIKRIRIWKLS